MPLAEEPLALLAAALRDPQVVLRYRDRVRTEARDALHLARLLGLDEVVSVRCLLRSRSLRGTWSGPGKRPGRT